LLIVIEPTTRCNFKCVHCTNPFAKEPPVDLSLELFQQVVPKARTAHELYLFGDGEVLLNAPRHLAMIAGIHQQGVACELGFSTNGKLLTPKIYELYCTAGIEYIQISVDAGSKGLYELMRRGGSLDELRRNLDGIVAIRRRSRARQPQLRMATVVSRQNYHELLLLAEFVKEYDFSYWYINAEYPHNPGRDLLRLTAEDLPALERIREDIVARFSSSFLTIFDPSTGLPASADEPWLKAHTPVHCTVPWQRFEMKANGDVKVCPYFLEPICSMKGRTFDEVWNGEEFRSVRQSFLSGQNLPRYCINCKLGMRWQYLPGFPGLPPSRAVAVRSSVTAAWSSLATRVGRKIRKLRTKLGLAFGLA
jgi:MoaA/NifB/PqqE/SkfB family radical SAM enzyme